MRQSTRSASGRAVLLDRDGTIAEDVNYCRRPEDFRLLPRAAEAVALLNRAGMPVVVVTNQSGIARGYFDWETLQAIHDKMRAELAGAGARVDAIYVCPHHPGDGCPCRKPRPGLLVRAASDLGIDLGASYVIGDREMDVLAGQACGCTTILVRTGPVLASPRSLNGAGPDYFAEDLYEGAIWITTRIGSSTP